MLVVSAAAWMLLVLQPNGIALPMAHADAMIGMPMSSRGDMLPAGIPAASLAAGWLLMLAAMMVPLLIAPVRHVRACSFAHRRARAIALFVAAYAAIWMAAGAVLVALATGIAQLATGVWLPVAAAVAVIAASVWQCSPAKQRCLNRCHAQPALAAFGVTADVAALRFGLTQGLWCVASCWALMLVPLLFAGWHVVAMAAAALWLFAERLDTPAPPRWRLRGPGKALRIAIARTRMPLQRRFSTG